MGGCGSDGEKVDAMDNPDAGIQDRPVYGKITDYDIGRLRDQIDVPRHGRAKRHDPVPTAAGISHFAFSYGDDNPLWHDPAHGELTRWGATIAPPTFMSITGVCDIPKPSRESRTEPAPFKGCGEYAVGLSWEWYRPVYAGDDILYEPSVCGVEVKDKSRFAGDRTVVRTSREHYVDRSGLSIANNENTFVIAERGASEDKSSHNGATAHVYTDEEIAEIDELYAAEAPRGPEIRYFEDVEVGDRLQPLAKGPLTVTDIIAEHLGRGMGHYGHGPLKYWWAGRQRMAGFYTKNSRGIPDVVQRLHWEDERAQEIGMPLAFDYGDMRVNWLTHLVTNWMGDDAWLWKLSCEIRRFNFLGDWHKMEGEVAAKRVEGGRPLVELEIKGTSQRGWITCPGRATVVLPSRAHGPVLLPQPPLLLAERGARTATERSARRRRAVGSA